MDVDERESSPHLGYTRMHIQLRAAGLGSNAPSDEELMALAAQRAMDPAAVEEYGVFPFRGLISNGEWDSYDTRMGLSTLRNYATEADAGRPFLRNHNSREDAIGRSLWGAFIQGNQASANRAAAAFFALKTPDDLPYIAKVRAGIVTDLSVGFRDGDYICSICNKDMRDWRSKDGCPHILGFSYQGTGPDGKPVGDPVTARATIENAHLLEVSGVYAASTPGAMITKAREMARDGYMTRGLRDLVQVRYNIVIPEPRRTIQVPDGWPIARLVGETEERQMDEPTTTPGTQPVPPAQETPPANVNPSPAPQPAPTVPVNPPQTDPNTQDRTAIGLRAALMEAGRQVGDNPMEALRTLLAEIPALRAQAKDGELYRQRVIDDLIFHGNRAMVGFNEETWRARVASWSTEHIKDTAADFAVTGKERFAPGRVTDNGTQQTVAVPKRKRPAWASKT